MTCSTVLVNPSVRYADNPSALPSNTPQETALFIPALNRSPYIFLVPGQRTILGRGDPLSTQQPDVDLSLYGASAKGVSRIHAAIEWLGDTAVVTDLDSHNGTTLNGVLLHPHQAYCLNDRDEIKLGDLLIYIFLG